LWKGGPASAHRARRPDVACRNGKDEKTSAILQLAKSEITATGNHRACYHEEHADERFFEPVPTALHDPWRGARRHDQFFFKLYSRMKTGSDKADEGENFLKIAHSFLLVTSQNFSAELFTGTFYHHLPHIHKIAQ
jgi:hypothetical protein